MSTNIEYDILSPDGISIEFGKTYLNSIQINKALDDFVTKYEDQGYYSSNNGIVDLKELKSKCKIIKIL